jgi:hypothetical protein
MIFGLVNGGPPLDHLKVIKSDQWFMAKSWLAAVQM